MAKATLKDGRVIRFPDGLPPDRVKMIIQKASGHSAAQTVAPGRPAYTNPWDIPGQALQNAPSDALAFGGELVNMAMHPIDTLTGVNDVVTGGLAQSETLQAANQFLAEHGLARKRNLQADAGSPQVQKAQAFWQVLKDDYGDWEAIKHTVATKPVHSLVDASMVLTGGGSALARVPLKAAQVTGRTLAKIGSETNPINMAAMAAKPVVSLAKQPINSLADALARRGALKDAASSLKVSPKAFTNVQEATGDIASAQKTASTLGPDAMVANLTPELTQDARLLAAMPVKNNSPRQALLKAARDQLDNSGVRAANDWEQAVGPAKSRYDKTVEIARTKAGTSSLYELAKGRTIDPSAIIDEVPKLVDAVKNNPQSRAAISEINDMLTDPRTGGFVTDAGELINARQRIDELIKSAGAGQTVTPGADLYEIGRRTTTGGHLARLRRTINDTLHQDSVLAQADATFSGAERAKSAFELGNSKIIGTGDSVMEPQALEARFAKMKPEEQAALLEGLSRKGKNAIGDVSPNRNEGKAFADAFAKPNNLERLEGLGVDSRIVQNMAAREDALAASSNRILGGSDTARTELARDRYPPPSN